MAKPKKKSKPAEKLPGLIDDFDEMQRRATAAWFRGGGRDQPAWNDSTMEQSAGKYYVVLRNTNGVMAVYRVRNDGVLKRLKRWPEEIE